MNTIQLLLSIAISCLVVVLFYYQIQVLFHTKPGMLARVVYGGWIFHPEYLEQGGKCYRKKLLASMAIFVVLTLILMFMPGAAATATK